MVQRCYSIIQGEPITVISSGIGAPLTGDCVIALGYSQCENIFSGSAGAIDEKLNIGDILICNEAVIGEGFQDTTLEIFIGIVLETLYPEVKNLLKL